MSTTTGATTEQIEAAITVWLANPGTSLSETEIRNLRPMRLYTIDDAAECLVKPDHRIVSIAPLRLIAEYVIASGDEVFDAKELEAATHVLKLIGDES